MAIFDFFKKILQNKKVKEIKQDKIAFSDIGSWLDKKRAEIEIKEKQVLVLIQNKIDSFTNEFGEKIKVVESFDVDSKKAEDKLKSITKDGRQKYLESVENFTNNLENLKKDKLKEVIEGVNKIFLDFNKSSHMSYERATILIGKEMADIKDYLKFFSRDLVKLFDENKNLVESSNTISIINLNLNHLAEIKKELEEINKTKITLNKEINNQGEENENILKEIEKIKKSENYIENLRKQEKIKLLGEELESEIFQLKQLINFKALTNFFHAFEKEMKIVKSHKEDFQTNFKRDDGASILHLLNESKLNSDGILEKVSNIKIKKRKIETNKKEIKKDETEELYSKTTKVILELGNLKNKKEREEKREEKLKVQRSEIIEEIKKGVGGIGGVFEI